MALEDKFLKSNVPGKWTDQSDDIREEADSYEMYVYIYTVCLFGDNMSIAGHMLPRLPCKMMMHPCWNWQNKWLTKTFLNR